MELSKIVVIAFFASIACYVYTIVVYARYKKQTRRRIEVAKKNGWIIKPRIVSRKSIDRAKNQEYLAQRTRARVEVIYEYEINGEKRQYKTINSSTHGMINEIYYDVENNNKVLNLRDNNPQKIILLIPIITFIGVILLGKAIFGI